MGILIFWGSAVGQESKIFVGLDYGSSVIQPSASVVIYTSGLRRQTIDGTGVPKQVRGMVGFSFHSSILLRVAAGYASTQYKDRIQFSNTLLELEHELPGYSAEVAIIFHAPIDDQEKFNLLFGLGGGFYSYTLKSKYGSESLLPSGTITRIPDDKFSGFAQTFIFGFSIRFTERLGITFELAKLKLGLSMIKEKQDILSIESQGIEPQKIGESEKNYNAAPGLEDLAMTLGVNFHL